MRGLFSAGLLAASMLSVSLDRSRADEQPAASQPDQSSVLLEKLAKRISLKDPIGAGLDLALTELADEHGLQGKIVIDKAAFKAEGVDDAAEEMVRLPKVTDMKLGTILEKLLLQVNGTYLVRDNHIEVTTLAARWKEMNLNDDDAESNYRKTMPVVRLTFKETALRKALEELGEKYEKTIILAPQVAEKGDAAVSARFVNVPLDTAVELLADMVDLKLVRKANVLFITTPERAEPLLAEEVKRKAAIRENEKNQLLRLDLEAKKAQASPAPAPKE